MRRWLAAAALLLAGAASAQQPASEGGPRVREGETPTQAPGEAPPAGPPTAQEAPAGEGDVIVLPQGRSQPEAEGPGGEKVVAALSHNQVSITTTYAGSEIFVFGAIKRSGPQMAKPDVVVTVSGPSSPVVVRRKSRTMGIWANDAAVIVDTAPSFYAVASTGPLAEVVSETEDLRHRIALQRQVRTIGAASGAVDPKHFTEALVRLREKRGLYVEAPLEVEVIEDTLFTTHIALPANIIEGDYIARVFLLHDGKVIDLHESVVGVRKVGLERWVFALSREDPLLYGLLSVFVALLAGWGASEAFRLLRRG